ncbi:hypothetical protein MEZE111188_05695 [Mesobacillus zeae]
MHDTLYFQVKRLKRHLTIILGRMGIFKIAEWTIRKLSRIIK